MKKYIIPALLAIITLPAQAQQIGDGKPFTMSVMMDEMGDIMLYVLLGIALVMLMMIIFVYNSVTSLRDKILAENDPSYVAKARQSFWGRVFQVSHTSTDKEVMIDHQYDNIQELNNPIPAWFMWLFYGTVVFAVVYLLNYHVFKNQKLQLEEYAAQMEQAEADYQLYLKTAGDRINTETVTALNDAASLEKGKELYLKPGSCASCHAKDGGGNIGPNLTDEFWIHGGGIKNIFKTISEGVPSTAMKAWGKDLSAAEVQQLSSYVLSLQGSKPEKPIPAQGEKWAEGAATPTAAPADSVTMPDSAVNLTSMK